MSDNKMNDQQNPQFDGQYGQQQNQQYAEQYGQQQNQQYAEQYGQQQNQQYTGQYGQQQNQQYAGQYGQQQNQQYAGQYGQQQNQQYAGQYGQQQNAQQYAGQYGQQQNAQQYAGQYGQQLGMQQYADQYGQQMSEQQNVYDQTVNMYGDQAHKPESPKKRKGIKIAIISVVAALVIIAALVVVYFVFLRKTPKEAVKDAMENTAKELETNNVAGMVGADDIDVDELDVKSEFTIDKISGQDQLNGSSFTLDAITSDNNFKLGTSATLAGETVNADFIMVGQTIYMACPDLFTKTFSFDMNSVMEELNGKGAGAGGSVDSEALKKMIEEDLKPATDKLAESIVYERVGKDEFTNANGKNVKADHYTITITKDAVDEFSQALVDFLNKYMDSNLSDDMMDEMGASKDQLKQMIGTLPSMISAIMTKDIVANVYVDGDKLIHVDCDYDLAAAGVKLSFVTDYMGDGNVTSDAVTKIALTYGTDVNVEFKSESKTDTSDDKISTNRDYTLSATSNGESQAFTGNSVFDYDKKSGQMSGSFSLDVQGESIKAAFEGVLTDISKGKSFSINDAKLTVTVSGEDVLQCSGSIKVAENDNKIEAPAADDVVDYSVLNGDDADKYINMDKAQEILSAWNEVFDSVELDSRLGDKLNTDGATDDDQETTEAATTEKDTTDKSTTEAATEEEDYSKMTITFGDKSVKINDPKGYERSYASEYSISLTDAKGDVYASYSAYESYSADELIKSMKDTYTDYYNDENSKIDDMTDGTVKAKDGTKVSYLVTQLTSYDLGRTEVLLVYPSGDGLVACSISYWDKVDDVDVQKLCDTFISAIEIQ